MDPNNTNNEELRDRLEREAREVVENARIEGEMLRREVERKAKEDEDRGSNNENDEELTFEFPICDIPAAFGRKVRMTNIPPSILPNFYGTSIEDPDSFIFEFDVLCRTYGYTNDTQKLILFPATLKGAALKWFMGLGVNTILYWINMKKIFLKKYQPYCQTRDSKDDIFRMTQHEEENLEDYLERFLYNLQKSKQSSLNSGTIKTIFLKGVGDDYINVLNLMGVGDISFLPFDQISELCRKYSRGKAKTGKESRDSLSKVSKSTSGSVTRVELGNLLENFKTNLLSTLSSQIDTLQVKKKEEKEPILSIYCSKCRNKHPLRDCSLDSIQFCGFCLETHSVAHCPTLQAMKTS